MTKTSVKFQNDRYKTVKELRPQSNRPWAGYRPPSPPPPPGGILYTMIFWNYII